MDNLKYKVECNSERVFSTGDNSFKLRNTIGCPINFDYSKFNWLEKNIENEWSIYVEEICTNHSM